MKHTGALLALLVVILGAGQLARAGYSPDEEFTIFAVRGIAAHGLPLLPSGLLYDRGLAYSYASWIAAALPGDDLVAFRALGLLSSALALILIHATLRRLFAGEGVAALATIAAATPIPFWAVATTGRFYGPFLLAYAGAVYLIQRQFFPALFVLTMCCRWTHELAFTLMAIPVAAWLLTGREHRSRWFKTALVITAGLVVSQLVIFVLHYSAPSSGDTMIRRFFLWQLLNLFERPPDRQFAIPLVVMLIGVVAAPARAKPIVVIALCISAMIVGYSTAIALRSAPLSAELIRSVLSEGSHYPLDMFWNIARLMPLTTMLVLAGIVFRLSGFGGPWRLEERAFHLAWMGWVLAFGVGDAGITVNYLLLPATIMLIAIAIDASAIRFKPAGAIAAIVLVAVTVDSWHRGPSALADARPTIHVAGLDEIRSQLQPADRVACTDELACLLLVGRVDAWLALDDFVRERFIVVTPQSAMVGVYAGAPAVFRPRDLFNDAPGTTTPDRVVIVDVFKEYPVGNSRTWLPRALAMDGLEARILLETPQARVVQVSAPIRNALALGTRH